MKSKKFFGDEFWKEPKKELGNNLNVLDKGKGEKEKGKEKEDKAKNQD
jgi:hypothetical protein